jgi:uncharacterized DUF497 family protein
MNVRFKYDENKSQKIKANPKRGITFEAAAELFLYPYYEDRRNDCPEQFREIGWVQGKLFSLIYEIRTDEDGEYYHFVKIWKSTTTEIKLYEKTYQKTYR